MKKLFGLTLIIASLITGQTFAQNTDPKAAEALKKLAALKVYGNSTVGEYPLCDDVIKAYPVKVDEVAYQNRKKGGSDTLPSDNEYTPIYAQYSSSSSSGATFGGACFSDETIVTIAYPLNTDVAASEISMVDVAEKIDDNEAQGLYILSSIIEAFPEAPAEYLKPCWGKVEGHTAGHLYDDTDKVCTITYGDNHSETCTPKHRFRVEVCDSSGKRIGCEWKSVSEIDPKTMNLLSDDNAPIKISTITPPTKIEDGWGFPQLLDWDYFSDLDVHNLTVETGTYFVGEKGNRVLVHNFKP